MKPVSMLCGNCKHYPRVLKSEALAFIESMAIGYDLKTLQGWMHGKKLEKPHCHKLDPKKVRFVELNDPLPCKSQHCKVSAYELACYAWKPRE